MDDCGNYAYSDWHILMHGAPQGSCLGPLLFLIFYNDLRLNLTYMSCIQFTDDTTLYCSHRNLRVLRITGIKAKPRKNCIRLHWWQRKLIMSKSNENWFGQTNQYQYLESMVIMTNKDVTTLKEIRGVLKGTGLWVDIKRFVKANKQFNPAGLFDLFGSFSDQTAEDVHDCLMYWIYDNYNNVKNWLKMAVLHKKIDLNDWIK